MIAFKIKSLLRNRRWKKYWEIQDGKNHVEFYRVMAEEWRQARRGTLT